MSDSQWPRYMVFQQHEPDDKLVHNGTIHAADAEMALQTSRDVFSRRPRAVRMWVVPAKEIYSVTLQELAKVKWPQINQALASMQYHVFGKTYQQGQCEQFGQVQAISHEHAMQVATETYADNKALWWWVFPDTVVVSSQSADADSMFEPVLDKHYRDQSLYPVATMMREIRANNKAVNQEEKQDG